jgi:tetratricopeptide (TPR) repeat protein
VAENSEQDRRKAKAFFDKGKTVADTGQYDYAIEMFLNGLNIDPDAVEAHQTLREISLMRKASGGKSVGMFEAMKLKRPSKDDKQAMLNAEKLLAFDPGNTDYMVSLLQAAHRAAYYNTAMWIGPVLFKANEDSKSPDLSKYLTLKDVYKDMGKFDEAVDALQRAMRMNTGNMDLQSELKNLTAQATMQKARYEEGFTSSVKDMDSQKRLMESEKDVVSVDVLGRAIQEAEAEWKANPNDLAKLTKLIDALVRTEDLEHENRATELLERAYAKTKQFPYRRRVGQIQMKQMGRTERMLRQDMLENPKDAQIKKDYEQFHKEQVEFELSEYQLALENYPSDLTLKYEVATRLFELGRFDEAIPAFQQARSDPKLKNDASISLGRAFLDAGFANEAIETLQVVVDEYQLKGDNRSKEMYYWQGRAFEANGNNEMALKRYSQVAQWEFTYKDVQQRIRILRGAPAK